MQLIDGKKVAQSIQDSLAQAVAERKAQGKKIPHLAAVLVGNDGGSETYVQNKVAACKRVGFDSTLLRFEDSIGEEALLKVVEDLNKNPEVDGFIVQLPLPKHISEERINLAIDARKDVDGFHPISLGKMMLGQPTFLPATPYGIVQLLDYYQVRTEGKKCVVMGRSNIVGTPMSILMARNAAYANCTVTLTHSRTQNLSAETLQADILIAALGKPEFVRGEMVKEGAVVIDVGTTRVPDASKPKGFVLKGDVHFESVAPKCRFITPVPGGVGPMTITSLLKNTLLAVEMKDIK